jgi:hypothetical protein
MFKIPGMFTENKLEDTIAKACATCVHKSQLKRESDPAATWCLKLMLRIDHPQFACMFYRSLELKKAD